MYFHPKDEYIYYLGNCDIKQRLTDRSASHFGRFAPQTRPMGCAICTVTTVTTIMILVLLGFIGESIANRTNINYWGRRSLFLLAYGLVICCFAAARDGLDKTIQNTIDGSCAPGMFSLVSIPNLIGCIGAAVIIIAAIATPIARSQHMRQIWFYVMSSGIMMKILVMEAARIIVRV